MATNWSYSLYVQLLLGGVAGLFALAFVAHAAARLLQLGLRLHGAAEEGAPVCLGGLVRAGDTGNERALVLLEQLWRFRNGMKQFSIFAINVSYIYVTGVLLQAWDCFSTSDGVRQMRNDPTTLCDSAGHKKFQSLAAILIGIVAPGVPICYTLWVRYLKRSAKQSDVLQQRAWRGLSDPLTRAMWGPMFEMYRYAAHENAAHEEQPMPAAAAATRRGRLLWHLQVVRYRTSVRISPYFESFIFTEKLGLVLCMHLIVGGRAQAAAQAAVYAIFALLITAVWPFQRLDVRVGLRAWAPWLPARWRPEAVEVRVGHKHPEGWRVARYGFLWVSHLTVGDALNVCALTANLVPLINIVSALIAGDNGEGVLQCFLIGAMATRCAALCTLRRRVTPLRVDAQG